MYITKWKKEADSIYMTIEKEMIKKINGYPRTGEQKDWWHKGYFRAMKFRMVDRDIKRGSKSMKL